ncbi:MAG: hypothetical protein ACOYME_11420, partial [Prochlorotrichaceae cyanobacterium]
EAEEMVEAEEIVEEAAPIAIEASQEAESVEVEAMPENLDTALISEPALDSPVSEQNGHGGDSEVSDVNDSAVVQPEDILVTAD